MSEPEFRFYIELTANTRDIRFGELAGLIARALVPGVGRTDDERLKLELKREVSRNNLQEELSDAVRSGRFVPLDPTSRGECRLPVGQHLANCEVTVESLREFVKPRGIGVRYAPHFVTAARPIAVPAELLALAPDARVTYEDNIGCQRGSGASNAGDYRAEVEATIARQSEGYFTLNEAAQVLADSRPGLDAAATVKRLRLAHSKGALPIHEGGSRFRKEVGETIRDFWELLEVTELDAWLRASVGYGFPPAAVAQSLAEASPPLETPKQRRDRLLATLEVEIAARGKLGALARIAEIEKRTRPTADRSNIGKEIKKAREERDAERRGGALTRLLG